jgi:uncharacterized protein
MAEWAPKTPAASPPRGGSQPAWGGQAPTGCAPKTPVASPSRGGSQPAWGGPAPTGCAPKTPVASPPRGGSQPAWGGPAPTGAHFELALFPLQSVLFPDGLLGLKVFEVRYLDLVSTCLREQRPFGVVALRQGGEAGTRPGEKVEFEAVGTLAELLEVDSAQPGILQVRCRGTHRFRVHEQRQQPDGLWIAQASTVRDDDESAPTETLVDTVRGLAGAIETLKKQCAQPFLQPYRFDSAGWVANRWCEILPLSRAAKQKLMELPDAQVRLELVDEFLRSKGVVA